VREGHRARGHLKCPSDMNEITSHPRTFDQSQKMLGVGNFFASLVGEDTIKEKQHRKKEGMTVNPRNAPAEQN